VLKLPRKDNVSFKLGIAVHDSLALAGSIWKKKEQFTAKDVERISDLYNKIAAREGIVDTNIYHEGLQMVMSRVNDFANGTILTVEDRFNVTTDEGVMLVGAMDKVEELNEETILVTDYKTSKYFETAVELKSDIQLSIYDIVANIKYPGYKRIILSLDYLRGDPVYTYRTDEERNGFLRYMLAVYAEMLKLKKEACSPTLNEMCSWCDFTDNCTAYQEALSGHSFIKRNPEEYSESELIKDYLEIKSKKRILDDRERQLKTYIMEKIRTDEKDMFGQGKKLYIRQNSFTVYDPKTVYECVPIKDFLKMVSLSKKDVDNYLIKNPVHKARITTESKKNYTSPFLAYKTIKK
jgi:hypothetical protein